MWWNLPGPRQFIRALADDLSDGKNLIVELPEHCIDAMRFALDEQLGDFLVIDEGTVDDDVSVKPLEVFRNLLEQCPTPLHQALSEEFPGRVFWIDAIEESNAKEWVSFLEDHSRSFATVPEDNRCLLLPVFRGFAAPQPERGEATLAIRRFEGTSGHLDMMLYVSQGLDSSIRRHPLHQALQVATIVELAGCDPSLADELLTLRSDELQRPSGLLSTFKSKRGWAQEANWFDGSCDELDGRSFAHSAVVGELEIQRRIWRAQVQILFPFVEELRVELVAEYRSHISMPVETRFASIDNPLDLEIGQLAHELRRSGIPTHKKRLLGVMKKIRNSLAHLELAEGEDVDEMLRLLVQGGQ